MAAEYQSVMSIGPNKVMNGNCEPPSGRTSIRSSHAVAFPPLYPIPSAPVPFSIRHESSLSSILNRLIGFYREPPGQRALGNHPLVRLNDRPAFEPASSYSCLNPTDRPSSTISSISFCPILRYIPLEIRLNIG